MKIPLFKVYFLFISIILFGCKRNENPCKLSEAVLKDIERIDSLTKIPEFRESNRIWNLKNYNEPSLLTIRSETYRCIMQSSFNGTKIFRIEKVDRVPRLIKKTFINLDSLPIVEEFMFSSEVWNDIVNNLSYNNFWSYTSSIERNGLDGTSWILEGYKPVEDECTGKNYHIITRWSPVDEKFIQMCNLITNLKVGL